MNAVLKEALLRVNPADLATQKTPSLARTAPKRQTRARTEMDHAS